MKDVSWSSFAEIPRSLSQAGVRGGWPWLAARGRVVLWDCAWYACQFYLDSATCKLAELLHFAIWFEICLPYSTSVCVWEWLVFYLYTLVYTCISSIICFSMIYLSYDDCITINRFSLWMQWGQCDEWHELRGGSKSKWRYDEGISGGELVRWKGLKGPPDY